VLVAEVVYILGLPGAVPENVKVPDQLQVPFTNNRELVKKINGPSTVVPAEIVVNPDIAFVTIPSVFLIPELERNN
jgi:hypothetical protein